MSHLTSAVMVQGGGREQAGRGRVMGGGRGGRDRPPGAAGQGVLELPWGLRPEDPGPQLPAGTPVLCCLQIPTPASMSICQSQSFHQCWPGLWAILQTVG